jgi:hypothetical protein
LVEFCKAAANSAGAARNAKRLDERLYDFYLEFLSQTTTLQQYTALLIDSLPDLSLERKTVVKAGQYTDEWTKQTDVSQALEANLVQEDNESFHILMTRLLDVFGRLLKDLRVHLASTDKVWSGKHCMS